MFDLFYLVSMPRELYHPSVWACRHVVACEPSNKQTPLIFCHLTGLKANVLPTCSQGGTTNTVGI